MACAEVGALLLLPLEPLPLLYLMLLLLLLLLLPLLLLRRLRLLLLQLLLLLRAGQQRAQRSQKRGLVVRQRALALGLPGNVCLIAERRRCVSSGAWCCKKKRAGRRGRHAEAIAGPGGGPPVSV